MDYSSGFEQYKADDLKASITVLRQMQSELQVFPEKDLALNIIVLVLPDILLMLEEVLRIRLSRSN